MSGYCRASNVTLPGPVPTQLVDSQTALAEFLHRWNGVPFLALDTEFIREQTYYPQLCLVQVGDGRDAACIDPLAGLDLRPLLDRLADPATTYVFHAAGQDLEIFVRLIGPTGLRAISKIVSLLLAAIAVSLIRRGWAAG